MGSDLSDSEYTSRRREKRSRDEGAEVHSRSKRPHTSGSRSRSRSRSRDRRRRGRSRTPDSKRRRSEDRNRDRGRKSHRDRPERSHRRDRSRDRRDDRESPREHEGRRGEEASPSAPDSNPDSDYASGRKGEESRRHRRRQSRSPSGEKAPFSSSTGPVVKRSGPLPDQSASFAVDSGLEPEKPREKPNYGTTGALAAAANAVATGTGETVTLKYHEPAEARKPPAREKWKMFVFKGEDVVDTVELGLRSCWLVGRDRAVVDLVAEHPSVSKQHAVLQFRYVERRNEFGDRVGRVRPYLIDLESANGTVLNGERVPESRYLEVRDRDVVKFGLSTREYVVMLDKE